MPFIQCWPAALALSTMASTLPKMRIIYTLTMDKIREIAVLKLIGTRNRTIAWMIMQQALALGVIGFVVGKITATFAAPYFPKHVLLVPQDSIAGFLAVMVICVLASLVAIRMALATTTQHPRIRIFLRDCGHFSH